MKCLLSFVVSVLLLASCLLTMPVSAQIKVKTDLKHEGLRGAVKYVLSDIYEIVDSGGKEQKVWTYTEEVFFNRKGNRLSVKNISPDARFNDSAIYVYDTLDNLIEERNYDDSRKLVKYISSTYGPGGNMLTETEKEYWTDEEEGFEDSSITIDSYRYNDLNMIEEIRRSVLDEGLFTPPRLYLRNVYEDSGRIRYQYTYRSGRNPHVADTSYQKLNRQGLILEADNAQTHSLYVYDSSGRMITSTSLWPRSPKMISKSLFVYDRWGNRTGNETVDSDGKLSGDRITSEYYSFDKKGNWKEVKSFRNGKWVHYCKRVIKYY